MAKMQNCADLSTCRASCSSRPELAAPAAPVTACPPPTTALVALLVWGREQRYAPVAAHPLRATVVAQEGVSSEAASAV